MATATEQSPLMTALPPATDYISYLTIVEQYLTKENLPILLQVLQDEVLTTNIGWDLVQLLLPLLPASEGSLQVIARLGNPREVILKVTEALRLIEYGEDDEDDGSERGRSTTQSARRDQVSKLTPHDVQLPLPIQQFITLLSMLTVLHTRIKTKYPSRFLSATLQAILASFSNSNSHREEMVLSTVQTTKQIKGVRRPTLPSRSSSGTLSRIATQDVGPHGADPEAYASTDTAPEEAALQLKLFQSFLTHVAEEYLTALTEVHGLAHMAWSTRLTEHLQPERLLPVPHDQTMTSQFSDDDALRSRVDAVGQLASLSQDLAMTDVELLQAITVSASILSNDDGEEEPPQTAEDVPLSAIGSALLYATKQMSAALYGHSDGSSSDLHIFPEHHKIVKAVLSMEAGTSLGSEPLAVVDACLALGLLALANDQIGEPTNDAEFEDYLRIIALLASNCPDPSLRGHAHYLASTVLRSHPDHRVRLGFIRDVLENSPMENLKPIAVGWLKGEIIEQVLSSPSPTSATPVDNTANNDTTRSELDSFADAVFPALKSCLLDADLETAWSEYQVNISFYLASLNFLYFLLYSSKLAQALKIHDFIQKHDILARFIVPLQRGRQRFEQAIRNNDLDIMDETNAAGREAVKAELNVLAQGLDRLNDAIGVNQ